MCLFIFIIYTFNNKFKIFSFFLTSMVCLSLSSNINHNEVTSRFLLQVLHSLHRSDDWISTSVRPAFGDLTEHEDFRANWCYFLEVLTAFEDWALECPKLYGSKNVCFCSWQLCIWSISMYSISSRFGRTIWWWNYIRMNLERFNVQKLTIWFVMERHSWPSKNFFLWSFWINYPSCMSISHSWC